MTNHQNRVACVKNYTYVGNIASIMVGQGRVAECQFASGPTFNNVPAGQSFQTNDIYALVQWVKPDDVDAFIAAVEAAEIGTMIYAGDFWG